MHAEAVPTAKDKRKSTKKSRFGCRTCRVRRIKCDETPGSCKNCTKIGRGCDYDIQRLPLSRAGGAAFDRGNQMQLPTEIAATFRWAITSDERRCYSYFQHFTVPMLSEVFYSPLWHDLIVQVSKTEPAVYHADLQNEWHRFALEQCGRSFALLSRRHSSQDPMFRNVVLLCCLLFVLAQLMRGQYDEAVQHISNGIRVLNEASAQGSLEQSVEPWIITAFAHLGTQSPHYGVEEVLTISHVAGQPVVPFYGSGLFANFHEAQQILSSVLTAACRFLLQCETHSEDEIYLNYASLQHEQMQLLSRMSAFDNHFVSFLSTTPLNRKEQRAADMMLLCRRSLSLLVQVALISDKAAIDYFTPEYEAHLSIVEMIMEKYPERPTVMLELGILPPLYNAAMWCRDFNVRVRAIKALRSWPHREGLFDSNWLAFLALQRMKIDLKIRPVPDATAEFFKQSLHEEQGRWQDLDRREFTLEDALGSTRCMRNWYCVRGLQRITAMRST
ncbi:Zn(II)2Cys6 transcription factor domain-containing protein [Aspergillus undulatus]|uniref:Zn(II)2Cys6 transcription factor domain-containing protein n=1 Tax=Aspergillus undulatus TaxID=1810928 RepID=UPI003CCC9F04